MKVITLVGLILIVVGAIVGFLGITRYQEERAVVRVGPLEVSAAERGFPTQAVIGGVVLVAGLAAVVAGVRAKPGSR